MDEVTFTDEGAKRVAELLNIAPSGACLYVGYGIGADGAGLGYVSEHGGCGLYIYSGGTAVGATLSIDRPLTDAELEAVLEAGGFKPAELAGYWEPIDARDIKVGDKLRVSRAPLVAGYYGLEVWRAGTAPDRRTYEEGYVDGSADGARVDFEVGYNKGFEEGRDAGVNDVRGMVAALTDIEEFDRVFEGAKAARLAYWDAIGEPRHSEPGPISLKGWVAALRAAAEV